MFAEEVRFTDRGYDARTTLGVEFLNPEQRTPILLIVDTSESVGDRTDELNRGLVSFKEDVLASPVASQRVDLGIVTFGDGGARVVLPFTLASTCTPPVLTAGGNTPLGSALTLGLDLVAERKAAYKTHGIEYTRPLVMVITDGCPTDCWQPSASRARQEDQERRIALFAVGYGNVDMNTLAKIAPPYRPPVRLCDVRFREFFLWLSASTKRVSTARTGEQLSLPPTDNWTTITA